jgi:hypothetical protein
MHKTVLKTNTTNPDLAAWKRQAGEVSLPEVHRSIVIPGKAPYWRKMLAFAGPGFLVAVGYMDPAIGRQICLAERNSVIRCWPSS